MATAAGQIELRKEFRRWVNQFWEKNTRLAQVVSEEFPDPDSLDENPTRYHVDAMRDLALRMGELVEGYDAGED